MSSEEITYEEKLQAVSETLGEGFEPFIQATMLMFGLKRSDILRSIEEWAAAARAAQPEGGADRE